MTGKHEADFLKITENRQILIANKQKTALFSKICKRTFFGAYQNDR